MFLSCLFFPKCFLYFSLLFHNVLLCFCYVFDMIYKVLLFLYTSTPGDPGDPGDPGLPELPKPRGPTKNVG